MGKAKIHIDIDAAASMLLLPPEYKVVGIGLDVVGDRLVMTFQVESETLPEGDPDHLISPMYEQVQAVRFVKMIG